MSKEDLTSTYISIRSALVRIVSGIAPPREIEDIVQETYVRACQAEKVRVIRTPRAFLYKTARNLAFDYVKKAETRLSVSDSSEDVVLQRDGQARADEAFDQICSDERFSQFCDAVRNLPIECRRTFVLKKVYGYSQKEIARVLGLSESTVEKHVAQGMKRCRYFMMQVDKREPVFVPVGQKQRVDENVETN